MERREFVTSLMASVAAVTATVPAHAGDGAVASAAAAASPAARVHVVVQAGVAHADGLARALARSLAAAGIGHTLSRVHALLDAAHVATLLPRQSGAALVGITDDAAAVVVQAVAASRGQACVQHEQHRIESASLASFVIRL